LSSAILYLAIVAIWAVVLVPRWLRPRAAPPQRVPVPTESPDADLRAPAGPGQDAGVARAVRTGAPEEAEEPAGGEDVADVSEEARDEEGTPETEVPGPPPASRRADVLKARRRLLTTLITLTVVAFGLAITRIGAYWMVIPPMVLLTGYVLLLRQFSHIDAQRANRAAHIRHAEAPAQTGQKPVPAATPAASDLGSDAPAAPAGAEIIDISGRIGDQVYDQYADAANRAVGD
jgi:hypothetical protein